MMKIFLNGTYCEASETDVGVFDRGFLFGDGVFTTLKVKESAPLYLDMHCERLQSSCDFFNIRFTNPGFSHIIDCLITDNQLTDARIKIIITRGSDFENRVFNYSKGVNTIAVLPYALEPHARQPVALCMAKEFRGNESLYRHKTISYLSNLYQKTSARGMGFDDAIILDWKGRICETSTANLFFIIGDEIITPPHDLPLLNGIMRQNLISQGSLGRYSIIEDYLTTKDLYQVTAAFITSCIVEIGPVSKIEQETLSMEEAEAVREEWLRTKSQVVNTVRSEE